MPKNSENLRKQVLKKETLLKAREQLHNLKRNFARRANRTQQKITFLDGELKQCEEDHAKCVEELEYLRKYLQARVNIEQAGKRGGSRRRRKSKKRKSKKSKRRKRSRKGGRKRLRRRTKVRRPYLMVKIERNPLSYKKIQKGGFLGALAKTAMGAVAGGGGGDPLGGLMKAGMGALGGGGGSGGGGLMDFAKKMGKDVLGRAKGGLMDKIGGFVNGVPKMGEGGGGGGGGGSGGEGELLSGTPSVELEECDPSERPEFPKGPDGCGKHESPKPTVKQLKQGYIDDNQVYQLENY